MLPSWRQIGKCRCIWNAAPRVFRAGLHGGAESTAATSNSFENKFAESAFVRAGNISGTIVKAKVIATNKSFLKLDLGTKFYSYVPKPSAHIKAGDEVLVSVSTTDFVRHVTGDAKPIAIFEADVKFVGLPKE